MAPQAAVLVIDDDSAIRECVRQMLADHAIPCCEAASGEEGLRIARNRRPSVVLVDVRLAGISGYETCRALREEFGGRLSILFVSGERTGPFDRVALLLGADDYITKPFAVNELLARIRARLRQSGGSDQHAYALTNREAEVLTLLAQGLDPA